MTYSLPNFEGPLDFLLHLIQEGEIEISDISLQSVTDQFKSIMSVQAIENNADFVSVFSHLLWIKSKHLLPLEEIKEEGEESEEYARFDFIHILADYCRFKEVAKTLSEQHQAQLPYYPRGVEFNEVKPTSGIQHMTLNDLASLFKEVLKKSSPQRGIILGNEWSVANKIAEIKTLIQEQKKLALFFFFAPEKSRYELIVYFLAILELLKIGSIHITEDKNGIIWIIYAEEKRNQLI